MSTSEHIEQVLRELDQRGCTHVRLGGIDIDGILRGKYITLAKFRSALESGVGFCDVIFGWDSQDELYDNVTLTGWHTGYPDLVARPDPSSYRQVPWDRNTPFFLFDFETPDGAPYPASPRQVLKGIDAMGLEQGYSARFAAEFEFFLFKEDSHSVRDKGYANLQCLSPGMFGYSALRASTYGDVLHDLLEQLNGFGISIEGIHTETGPGVYETAIAHDLMVQAADHAALFKTAAKEILNRHGLMVTFMAKVNQKLPGCSGHVHQSLWKDGKPVFHDASDPEGMSAIMRSYVAGVLALMPDMMSLYCPTINSYKRTVPGLWAPTTATWGFENRTAALRVIRSRSGKATRVENRLIGADMNPYLAFAASYASGLWGISQGLSLGPGIDGNAYEADQSDAPALPRSLAEATERLASSAIARELLGDTFVDHYAATRRWEVRAFDAAVTNWELERYFEII